MFRPRLTRPEIGNKYYNTVASGGYSGAIKGNPICPGCNVLANCVGYAAGRFNEIIGAGKFLYLKCPPNAEDFYDTAIAEGLKVGKEPKLGAIIVWAKGKTWNAADGAGHVAVVEQINEDGSITTSESGYGCANPFWTSARKKGSDGNWGQSTAYRFLGFIYQPEKEESMKNGIDISYCQKKIDWDRVDAEFCIIRAGYGKSSSQKDTMFESHYTCAKKRGIPVGAYWYSYAMNEDDARQEADACIAVLAGKQFEYPIYYDVEEQKQFALGKDKVSAIIKAFLERLEAAGYWVGLYGSYSSLTTYTTDDIRTRYAIWLAHWGVEKSPYTGAYGVWQHKVGSASGVTGDCDLDYSYVDYPSKIKAKGLNGYGKPPETDEIYVEMTVDGEKYTGNLKKA